MLSITPSPVTRCEELQLRLAETEEQLAFKEEAASVVLGALAATGDPEQAERRKHLARVAHREALRAAEHAAALRQKFAERARTLPDRRSLPDPRGRLAG